MHVDLGTLYAVTTFATAVSGMMLLFSWLQDRSAMTLAWWGGGMLVLVAGGGLLALRGVIPDRPSIVLGNTLWLAAYGAMWCGARSFEGRRPALLAASAAALLWVALCQTEFFSDDAVLRVRVFSVLNCALTLLIAREYWYARNPELVSRWPAIVLLIVHAAIFLLRVPFADRLVFPIRLDQGNLGVAVPAGIASLLLHYFCMAFLVMAMVKERLGLEHRREALVDPLTGIANRRAFFARAELTLGRMAVNRVPAALLMLDVDHFKRINDTLGHEAGDRVLCGLCEVVSGALRPNDLFGRTGGEEFVCLLPGAGAADAVRIAERIRTAVARLAPRLGLGRLSVSVGVAATPDFGRELVPLMAAADRALYRAKANGRNRVERAVPVHDAPPDDAGEPGVPAAIAAAMPETAAPMVLSAGTPEMVAPETALRETATPAMAVPDAAGWKAAAHEETAAPEMPVPAGAEAKMPAPETAATVAADRADAPRRSRRRLAG